jgi:hypothetical protein
MEERLFYWTIEKPFCFDIILHKFFNKILKAFKFLFNQNLT